MNRLGGAMTALAALVSVTDICVPSMIFHDLFARAERDVQLTSSIHAAQSHLG